MRKHFVMLVVTLAIPAPAPALAQADSAKAPDVIPQLVARLDLERYKATIKGLTAFGDRRQGTDRNRAAVDWIEAQLRSYGCSDVSRLKYDYQPPSSPSRSEEHTSELQSQSNLVCRLLLEKKKKKTYRRH